MSFIIQIEFPTKETALNHFKGSRSILAMEKLVNQLIGATEGKPSVIPKIRSMVIPEPSGNLSKKGQEVINHNA